VSTPPPLAQSESLPGLDRTPDLTNAIFATGAGEVGPTIGTKQGFVVFRVSEKLPSHVPPLSETRDRVEQAMRQQRAEELAKSKAEALLPQVQKAGIESVAAQNDLKVDETGPFGRRGTAVPKIGSAPELKKAAFQLTTENPVAPAVYAIPGASVLAALKERIPADEAKFAADKDQLMRQAEERAKGEAMEEFLNYLKAHASIELGEEYLASIPETGHPLDGGPRRRR
jgi:peptidyl-prolyl cis-trans isomerase D